MRSDSNKLVGLGLAIGMTVAGPAVAADLPYGPGPIGPEVAARGLTVRPFPAQPFPSRPYFAEASRFDIYGYPVIAEAPNPLYASTGCPPALQPIYDATGNFAGYHPIQACR